MADIERRPNRTPRASREARAYRLVVGGSVAAVVAVVGVVLAVVGVIGGFIPLVAIIIAAVCFFLFRRAVS
ncbi:MAG: hypothetical protein JHC95_05605 [Solirubrobacteraceae bacterium]|nr:hypothetical protein [Solirubrobacteraceae bacterium]